MDFTKLSGTVRLVILALLIGAIVLPGLQPAVWAGPLGQTVPQPPDDDDDDDGDDDDGTLGGGVCFTVNGDIGPNGVVGPGGATLSRAVLLPNGGAILTLPPGSRVGTLFDEYGLPVGIVVTLPFPLGRTVPRVATCLYHDGTIIAANPTGAAAITFPDETIAVLPGRIPGILRGNIEALASLIQRIHGVDLTVERANGLRALRIKQVHETLLAGLGIVFGKDVRMRFHSFVRIHNNDGE